MCVCVCVCVYLICVFVCVCTFFKVHSLLTNSSSSFTVRSSMRPDYYWKEVTLSMSHTHPCSRGYKKMFTHICTHTVARTHIHACPHMHLQFVGLIFFCYLLTFLTPDIYFFDFHPFYLSFEWNHASILSLSPQPPLPDANPTTIFSLTFTFLFIQSHSFFLDSVARVKSNLSTRH